LKIDEWTDPEERDRGWELMNFAVERGFPPACGFTGIVEAGEHRFHPERLDGPALPLLRLGAVRGDYEAARCLAESLRTLGGDERYAEAVYWLRKASLRDPASSRVLAEHHFTGHGVPRSNETGAAWLALASEEGDAKATSLLASAFHEGVGVPLDQDAAIRLAERAAAAGCASGARLLGCMYDDGAGVPRDGERAVAWFERGAELGDRESEYCLANVLFDGRGVDPDPARAFRLLERASGIIRDHADHLLALMLFRGEGVSPDPARARTEFLQAADGRHLPSLFTTLDEEALRYRPAALRPRDLRDAISEMAADPEGLTAAAALDLGLLYWNADAGLSEDRTRAAELLRVAAVKGSALAAACLSHALNLDGDEDGEMEWLEKAARAGLPGAERHLAVRLVETGRASWEEPRVVRLLESAADRGDVRACVKLADLLGGPGEPQEPRLAERIRALKRCAEDGGYAGEEIFEY
jgi:TPR repeat protein